MSELDRPSSPGAPDDRALSRPATDGYPPPSVWGLLRYGPRALLNDTKPRWIDRLLPFWIRWPILLAALVVGITWSSSGLGEQIAAMLQYAALVAVSLGASFWMGVGLANLIVALLWFIPFKDKATNPGVWFANHAITFANRHAGHTEALYVWLVISLAAVPDLRFQLPVFLLVVLLGISIINALTYYVASVQREELSMEELYWRRRPFIYLFTFLGLTLLALRSWSEAGKLVPLAAAIVAGLVPRLFRHRRRMRRVRGNKEPGLEGSRQRFREAQVAVAHRLDAILGPLALIAGLGVVVGLSWKWRQDYDHASAPATHETDDSVCNRDVGGPAETPEAALFLVADTQLHELGGKRFPGQTELADAVVPVAVRPVELDLLSATTFWQLGNVYAQMKERNPQLGWAHLGDVGDLGCRIELERIAKLFPHFGVPAGLAPGNHDSSFTGNFFWNPYWPEACKHGPVGKPETNELLSKIVAGNPQIIWRKTDPFLSRITGRGGALVSVSPLGVIHDHDDRRGLIGVFVDTADGGAFDFGVAGLFGTFSDLQADELESAIRALQLREKAPYDDPVFIVFGHHPFVEVASPSRKRLQKFIETIDRMGKRADRPAVLALITAHTHFADSRKMCIGGDRRHGRTLHELVIGSTIDPPQQAAHLVFGPDERKAASLRLTTFPVVARPGKTCGAMPDIPALACQGRIRKLRDHAACAPLFERTGDRLGPDCKDLEKDLTLSDRVKQLRASATGFDPTDIRKDQAERAARLFACVCRDGSCTPPADPLDDEQYAALLGTLMPARDRLEELTCLSWAASALQQHKAAGMQMADALRCAFDDGTLPAAREMVSTLEAEPCR
jgi:hypothetical protein